MVEEKRSILSKILLFAGILGFPAFFILFFALGKQNFEFLQYYGEHTIIHKTVDGEDVTDTIYYKIPNFIFYDSDSNSVLGSDFEDRILVFNFVDLNCPNECNMDFQGFKMFVGDEIVKNDGFSDVDIISCVLNPDATKAQIDEFVSDHQINEDRWKFVTGDMAQIYNTDMKIQNPWQAKDDKYGFEKVAYIMTILVDKDKHIRGKFITTQTSENKRVTKEISILLREMKENGKK